MATSKTVYRNKRYPKATFYVNGEPKQFENGVYTATTQKEKAVLDKLPFTVAEKTPESVGDIDTVNTTANSTDKKE